MNYSALEGGIRLSMDCNGCTQSMFRSVTLEK